MNAKLIARLQLFCCAAVLICVPTARTSGQTTPEIARIVANNQYDLSSTGQQFLQQQANKASFVLVGGLHGDNETQMLLNVVMNGLADGPRLIITEMSPWAANRLGGHPKPTINRHLKTDN
jgi:hypothetical protein